MPASLHLKYQSIDQETNPREITSYKCHIQSAIIRFTGIEFPRYDIGRSLLQQFQPGPTFTNMV